VLSTAIERFLRRPRHANSAVYFPQLGNLGVDFPPCHPTFRFPGQFINNTHQAIARLPVDGGLIRDSIPGFLRPADALALYEHAYFATGDVLELGSAWGLSTRILCRAVQDSGRNSRVTSIEILPEFQEATARAISNAGLTEFYESIPGDAASQCDTLVAQSCRFAFAFIDHDHSHQATRRICTQLPALLQPGGYALFHDFNDARNQAEPELYGVYRGVEELLQSPDFSFERTIGCCALLRRRK
jgi:cephalosporin hydroxylase